VKDVPVDAFLSIIVYNAEGFVEKNSLDAYSFKTARSLGVSIPSTLSL